MQTDKVSGKLVKPTRDLLTSEQSDTVYARDAGQAVGEALFAIDDPDTLVSAIFNLESYYHSLREAALENLKKLLARRYTGLAAVAHRPDGIEVTLKNGGRQMVPVHTSPSLAEFVMGLEPAEGCHDAGTCLKLLQQTARLLDVLGQPQASLEAVSA